jgi:hypothetical protein
MKKEEQKCNFDVNGVCYAMVCYTDLRCGAKDDAGNLIRMATVDETKERSRLIETIKNDVAMPKMTVMQPTVVNADGPPDENVAPKDLLCSSDNRDNYHDCDDYNTEFCRQRCEFGPKENPVSEFDSEQSTILPKIK